MIKTKHHNHIYLIGKTFTQSKILFSALLLILFGIEVKAQTNPSVIITGKNSVEVGLDYNYTATVKNMPSNDTIRKYVWTVELIDEVLGGPSGIKGKTSAKTVTTSNTSATFTVKWGDSWEGCYSHPSAEITVTVHYTHVYYTTDGNGNQVKHEDPETLDDDHEVKIMWLETPTVSPTIDVQRCCTDTIRFCAQACKGDEFTWTVTGGTFPPSQQGKKCITVTPTALEDIKLDIRAKRKTGLNNYYRDGSQTIGRINPSTPPIEGPEFICQGEMDTFCIDKVCGIIGANWTVPNTLNIVNGQGTKCIVVSPDISAPDGSTANISARGIFEGGCVPPVSNHSVKVYSSETPPVPEGDFEIIFEFGEESYDPCKDDEEATWEIVFIPDEPYLNGITTVTPGAVIDVPHHNIEDRITVIVCNVNFCSGEKTCRTWTLFLPSPCDDEEEPYDDIFGGKLVYIPNDDSPMSNESIHTELSKPNLETILQRNKIDYQSNQKLKIDIFPNPTKGQLTIQSNQELIGSIKIYSVWRKEILTIPGNGSNKQEIFVDNIEEGIYYLIYEEENDQILKSFIIQK